MELQQPLGYRFYPTEEELVSFYLYNKLEGRNEEDMQRVIPVIDIYDKDPWDLPQLAGERCRADTEQWFFFVPRQEREASGGRISRSTASGCWKATGSPGYVYSSDRRVIGLKRSMVFYRGTAHAGGRKTKWKMHEYKAMEELPSQHSNPQAAPRLRHEFTLCRVYVISGSFRAFDRRPIPGETWLAEAINAPGGGDDEPAADNPESSRPEDVPSSFEESVWDWDQLDWLWHSNP